MRQSHLLKYSFYECGFKPTTSLIIEFPLHIYCIIVFVIICDVECFFLIMILVNFEIICVVDFCFICLYFCLFIVGFVCEFYFSSMS